jgi:hypothetical protein
MGKDPSVPDRRREDKVPQRFVDEIREDGTDGAGDEPPPVMEELGTEEPEHDTGEEVEEEIHRWINLCAGCYKKGKVVLVFL